jgi:hypothetical protein
MLMMNISTQKNHKEHEDFFEHEATRSGLKAGTKTFLNTVLSLLKLDILVFAYPIS